MATTVVWLRRLPLPAALWWTLPSSVLALAVLGWQLSLGEPLLGALEPAGLILLLGLAGTAARRDVHVGAVPLDGLLLCAAVAFALAAEVAAHGPRPGDWDLLLVTGGIAFLAGAEMVRSIPSRLRRAIKRLIDCDVLGLTPERRAAFEEHLAQQVHRWAFAGSLVLPVLVLVGQLAALLNLPADARPSYLWFVVLDCLFCWIAGDKLGRVAACSFFWRPLTRDSTHVRLIPGHLDGAGGFKPLGDLFFYQSIAASIPAIFFVAWWWLAPLWPGSSAWRHNLLGGLVVAIVFEVLVFVLPMLSIHATMREQKAELVSRADLLSRTIISLQTRLSDLGSADQRQGVKEQIADLTEEYQRVQRVPTWPIDSSIRRRFSLNNLALFLPLLGHAIGGTAVWEQLSEALRNLGT
jgi:hypothetical protein